MINEKIVLAPGINGTELLRSLAANGSDTFGMRIVSSVELARRSLAGSGIAIPGSMITSQEEAVLILRALGGNGYYSETSFSDAAAVAEALHTLRQYIVSDEENEIRRILGGGRFRKKNDALIEIWNRYMAYCRTNGLIDAVSLVRFAAEHAKPLNCECCVLAEVPVTPLDKHLLGRLSGGAYRSIAISDLTDKKTYLPEMPDIVRAYGAVNEAEHIINDIIKSTFKSDECIVAVTDTSGYSQLFYDIAVQYDLPITFGCGVPILNANPAKLLSLINKWDTDGYHGKDALGAMVYSDAFDRSALKDKLPEKLQAFFGRAVDNAGEMRLSMDARGNAEKLARYRLLNEDPEAHELADAMEIIFHEFERGYQYIVEKFSLIRKGGTHQGKIDRSAVKVIGDALKPFIRFDIAESIPRIVPEILNKTVSSENSREGFLHVTSVEGAQCVLRRRLYIAGLSARFFPGMPREDPVIMDDDYAQVLEAAPEELPTADNVIRRKREALADLIGIYRSLSIQPILSFSGYDLCELKQENPSAALFELYGSAHKNADFEDYMSSMRRVGFFENTMSTAHGVGRAFINGAHINAAPNTAEPAVECRPRTFSPSAIETFFVCPHRFFLAYIVGIRPVEPDDPFIWMNEAARGTLAHAIMEDIANRPLSERDFMLYTQKKLDEYASKRPPISDMRKASDDFIAMMMKAYSSDPGNEVVLSEEMLSVRHGSGITVAGKPDGLEKTPSGEYIVVDYKTGSKIVHRENDAGSCLQTLLYAYMLSAQGINVSRCEYRYMRYSKTVTCVNNGEMQDAVSNMLDTLASALPDISRMYTDDHGNCNYCEFSEICSKGEIQP